MLESECGSLLPLLFPSGRFSSLRASGFACSHREERVHVCSARSCELAISLFNLEDIGSTVLVCFWGSVV